MHDAYLVEKYGISRSETEGGIQGIQRHRHVVELNVLHANMHKWQVRASMTPRLSKPRCQMLDEPRGYVPREETRCGGVSSDGMLVLALIRKTVRETQPGGTKAGIFVVSCTVSGNREFSDRATRYDSGTLTQSICELRSNCGP